MVALLDANVLLALFWPSHVHHELTHRWFSRQRTQGWATCALTEAAFVRLSANPAVMGRAVTIDTALSALHRNTSLGNHHFWSMTRPLQSMDPEMRGRIRGPGQVTDAILLDLAVANKGKLSTLDRGITALVPGGFGYLEVID